MIAHFFDIDSLITVDNEVWIVSKSKPSIPIIKISPSEFNIIKKGVYKKHKQPLVINGFNYWMPGNLMDELKIKCKIQKCEITNLAFSMQEFMNPGIIENLNYEIHYNHFNHLKNKTDDIYVICSKNTKKNYEFIIDKLEEKLLEEGLKIKKYYYISETFYNRNEDQIAYKKIRLLLQHLIGLKTKEDIFTEEEITKYNKLYYYDDNVKSLQLSINVNEILKTLYDNSDDNVKSKIKESLQQDTVLYVNQTTYNKVKIFDTKEVIVKLYNIVKTFEFFKFI